MKYIALLFMAMLAVANMALQFIAVCLALFMGASLVVGYAFKTILFPSKD